MFQITKREAAQFSSGRLKIFRRAFARCIYEKGHKVPLYLVPGKAILVAEVVGVSRMTVGQMDDKRAKEEGFDSLAQWKDHWAFLYRGTNNTADGTVVYCLRVRRSDLTHGRRKVVEDGGLGDIGG